MGSLLAEERARHWPVSMSLLLLVRQMDAESMSCLGMSARPLIRCGTEASSTNLWRVVCRRDWCGCWPAISRRDGRGFGWRTILGLHSNFSREYHKVVVCLRPSTPCSPWTCPTQRTWCMQTMSRRWSGSTAERGC